MWYCKTVIVVRVKGVFLRRLGEAIGRTIIWSAEQIRQTRQGRIGGLLDVHPSIRVSMNDESFEADEGS